MADTLAQAPKSQVVAKLRAAQSRIRSLKSAGESAVTVAIQSATIAATAGATGYMRGRMSDENGEWKVKKVPVELLLAGGAHVLGAVFSAKVSQALHNAGDGPLAFWIGMKGYEYGLDYKSKHPQKATQGRRILGGQRPNMASEVRQQQAAPAWR